MVDWSTPPRRDDLMDTTSLRQAYDILLEAAATVTGQAAGKREPPAGEWNGDQVLAHVSLVTAGTVAVAATVAAGENATYDNRVALDLWTINHTIALAGSSAGLRERLRVQADALCGLVGPVLSEAELDTAVPTRLLSGGSLLLDQPVPLRDLIVGLAETELPDHAEQLYALLPEAVATAATT
jgi:hypothetical protein